ncbi:hypothetical protein MIMGU_mgv1a018925mg, partial [Erythranthe guttata]
TRINTKVIGLVSKPVSHSKGPLLHNPTFRHVGYNWIYVPMLVIDLNEFFRVYSTPDFSAFSVGIPYKEAIIGLCVKVHPLAQRIGVVNTIVRSPNDGEMVGNNTDYLEALSGKLFVLVGAGRALAFGAKIKGARATIFNIDFDRAKLLARAVSDEALHFEDLRRPDYKLVFDGVYNPRKTRLLKEADGAIVVSGVKIARKFMRVMERF